VAGRFSSPSQAASAGRLLETATAGTLPLSTSVAVAAPLPSHARPAHLAQLMSAATDLNEDPWEGAATSTCGPAKGLSGHIGGSWKRLRAWCSPEDIHPSPLSIDHLQHWSTLPLGQQRATYRGRKLQKIHGAHSRVGSVGAGNNDHVVPVSCTLNTLRWTTSARQAPAKRQRGRLSPPITPPPSLRLSEDDG